MVQKLKHSILALPVNFSCTSVRLSIVSAIFITIANNGKLYSALSDCLNLGSLSGSIFLITVYFALSAVLAVLFMTLGNRFSLKPIIIGMRLSSAAMSYFTVELGVVFDTEMLNSILENVRDQNSSEALELLSLPFLAHVAILGLLPTWVVVRVDLQRTSLLREVLARAGYCGLILSVLAVSIFVNLKDISYIARKNRSLKVYVTPTYGIDSLRKLVSAWLTPETEFEIRGEDAVHVEDTDTRTVGIMVVGETSRADHWSLNGYSRPTNPLLSKRELFNFTEFQASGTSTAYSVPCMFSLLPQSKFTKAAARRQSNVLDVIDYAGVEVHWIDNNSSSKGVADRLPVRNLLKQHDANSRFAVGNTYYDEVLLEALTPLLDESESDLLVVLHMMGSHGPAYYLRCPPEQIVFSPSCQTNAPQNCSDELLINAYDNTIVYTDYVLDKLIELLDERSGSFESFVFYASDHGESLGENGVYLHGLPDFLAPSAQTHVPALLWLSDSYNQNHAIESAKLGAGVNKHYSHDCISHTLLSLLDIRTSEYIADLDLLHDAKPQPSILRVQDSDQVRDGLPTH